MLWHRLSAVVKPFLNHDEHLTKRLLDEAAAILKRGGLVAFPTETVYGLGANALDANAVNNIFKAKGRPNDNPLIAHIAQLDTLHTLAKNVPAAAYQLADAFWPGPLTMIFHKTPSVPLETSGGLETVAVRFPAHLIAQRLICAAGFPLAAPSANISGRPSPTTAAHVAFDLADQVELIIDGGACAFGLESTIVDLTVDPPCLLRPGSITKEMLEAVIGPIGIDPFLLEATHSPNTPKAPGMKYTHYAPLAAVTIVCGTLNNMTHHIQRLVEQSNQKTGIMATTQTLHAYQHNGAAICLNVGDRQHPETIAANLFATLRNFDALGVDVVYAEGLEETGVGLAIMNRLKKAAGFNIINV